MQAGRGDQDPKIPSPVSQLYCLPYISEDDYISLRSDCLQTCSRRFPVTLHLWGPNCPENRGMEDIGSVPGVFFQGSKKWYLYPGENLPSALSSIGPSASLGSYPETGQLD